jgi:hypothetical protein
MSSNTSKIAAMAALSMVLTPASAPLAKTEDGSPRDGAKITAPIDLDEEAFYWAIPDEALEIMAEAKSAYTTLSCGKVVTKPTSAPSAPKSQRGK